MADRSTEGAGAEVRRERGVLKLVLCIPGDHKALEGRTTARVLTALRAFDHHAPGIDISIEC